MVFRLEEWLNHKLHLPPEREQRRIASCVGWLEHEILLLSRQLEALTKQKKGLMQMLLTGKLRVPAGLRELTPAASTGDPP